MDGINIYVTDDRTGRLGRVEIKVKESNKFQDEEQQILVYDTKEIHGREGLHAVYVVCIESAEKEFVYILASCLLVWPHGQELASCLLTLTFPSQESGGITSLVESEPDA
jgi:hypothetical protein